jgi:hypothetical protein
MDEIMFNAFRKDFEKFKSLFLTKRWFQDNGGLLNEKFNFSNMFKMKID